MSFQKVSFQNFSISHNLSVESLLQSRIEWQQLVDTNNTTWKRANPLYKFLDKKGLSIKWTINGVEYDYSKEFKDYIQGGRNSLSDKARGWIISFSNILTTSNIEIMKATIAADVKASPPKGAMGRLNIPVNYYKRQIHPIKKLMEDGVASVLDIAQFRAGKRYKVFYKSQAEGPPQPKDRAVAYTKTAGEARQRQLIQTRRNVALELGQRFRKWECFHFVYRS